MLPAAAKGHHPGAGSRSCKKHIFFLGHSFEQAADAHPYTEEREGAKLRSTVVYSAGEGRGGAREREGTLT
jgi:hypothetical protein